MKRHHIVLFGLVAAVGVGIALWPRSADTPTTTEPTEPPPFDPDAPQGRDRLPAEEPQDAGREELAAPAAVDAGMVVGDAGPRGELPQLRQDASQSAGLPPVRTDETDPKAAAMNVDPRMAAYRDGIKAAIANIKPRVAECYASALKQDPSMAGSIKITFEIKSVDGGGRVVSGEVPESEVRSPFFEACVLEKVGGAEFPEPLEGGTVKVTYPFHFDPGGGYGGDPSMR